MAYCFPKNDGSPNDDYFVASKCLGEAPTLSREDEANLDLLIERMLEDDSAMEVEGEESDEDQPANAVDEEVTPQDIIDDNLLCDLLESATAIDEPQFDILAVPFAESALLNYNARSSGKGKPTIERALAGRKAQQRNSAVTVVSRLKPDKHPKDPNDYSVVTYSNGLQAVLVRKSIPPENNMAKQYQDFMETFEESLKREKERSQKKLPPNFPVGFPLANRAVSQAIRKIIQTEFRKSRDVGKSEPVGCEEMTFSLNSTCSPAKNKKLQATIAVVVNAGTCEDPIHCQGLAHFCEHVVHYGSTKYPKEEEYFSFSSNYGYGVNAFTENHATTYYNTLPIANLGKGMDMLGSLLSKPLFEGDMTCREVNAVDAEFNLSRHLDILRRRFLFQNVIKGHPLSNFDCGNTESLLSSKNIHDDLRNFHSKYYVASSMCVALESTLPLATQEKMVLEHFSQLSQGPRKTYRETPPTAKQGRIGATNFNRDYVFQGLSTISNVWVAWPIPETFLKNYDNKSLSVLLTILGQDAEGSLADYLTKQEYIWLMLCNKYQPYSDPAIVENKYIGFVTIDFFLTPKGEANVADVIAATYDYITQLGAISDSKFLQTFNTMKLQAERNYNLLDRSTPPSPLQLAKSLQCVPPKDILKDDSWLWNDAVYSPKEIRGILGHMQVTNMILIQSLPPSTNLRTYTKVKTVSRAPLSNAEYVMQPIEKRFRHLTSKKSKSSVIYNFPLLNEKVNSEVGAIPAPVEHGEIEPRYLQLNNITDSKVLQAAHIGNMKNNHEKMCLVNYLDEEVQSCARNLAMSLLWTASTFLSLKNELKNDLSSTSRLVWVSEFGITIGIVGLAERLQPQMAELNENFFTKPISEASLTRARAALLSVYDLALAPNAEHITEELLHFMTCKHYGEPLSDVLVHIRECSVTEVNQFALKVKLNSLALVIFGGNISLDESHEVVDLINKQGQVYESYISPLSRLLSEVTRIDSCYEYNTPVAAGQRCLRVKSDNNYSYTTTVINFYYVGTYQPATYLLWWNSLYFFPLRAFISLRMKKQLGYHIPVYLPKPHENNPMVIGVGVTATASKFTACELENHIDEFMVEYGKFLDTVDEKTFKCIKAQRARSMDKKSVNLKMAYAKSWYEQHFGETFASNNPRKYEQLGLTKISVQVLGQNNKSCACEKCLQIVGWERCTFWNHFRFAQGATNKFGESYFINDPQKLRSGQ